MLVLKFINQFYLYLRELPIAKDNSDFVDPESASLTCKILKEFDSPKQSGSDVSN